MQVCWNSWIFTVKLNLPWKREFFKKWKASFVFVLYTLEERPKKWRTKAQRRGNGRYVLCSHICPGDIEKHKKKNIYMHFSVNKSCALWRTQWQRKNTYGRKNIFRKYPKVFWNIYPVYEKCERKFYNYVLFIYCTRYNSHL